MKKNGLLFIGLFLTILTFGQRNYWKITKGKFYYSASLGYEADQLKREQENYKKNGIQSLAKINYNDLKKRRSLFTFNTEGKVISIERKSKKGKYVKRFSYDNKENLVRINIISSFSRKTRTSETNLFYNEQNKLTKKESITWKGNYYGYVTTYNSEGKITAKQIFEKDKEAPKYTLEYSYYPDGSKQQDVFKKKEEIKHIWNYDCKPEGELLNVKHKDNSVICIKEETDSAGNRIEWRREFNEKGKLVKTKSTFSKDSNLIAKVVFNQQDRILNESKYAENGSFKTIYYNKKGKESHSYEILIAKNKQIKKIVSSGNWPYTHLYNYEGELKSSVIRIQKRNTYVEEFQYTLF